MGVFGPATAYALWGDPGDFLPHYEAMRSFVEYLNETAGPSRFVTWGLGDWLSTSDTCMHNSTLINSPGFYLMAHLVSAAAGLLGDAAGAAAYAGLASDISAKYLAAFYNSSTGVIATGEQCFQALTLGLEGFLPAEEAPAVAAALLARVAADNFTLTTGFVTFGYMLDVLKDLSPDAGQSILLQRMGAGPWGNTAGSDNDLCKEEWDGSDAEMPSLVGPLATWSQESIAGLRADPTSPGMRARVMRPNVGVGGMLWASLQWSSPRGPVAASWSLEPTPRNGTSSGSVRLTLSLPAGSTATVFVPTLNASSVTEGGLPAVDAPGVTFLRQDGDSAVFSVTSGFFAFAADFALSAARIGRVH
jgi:alpha-L-rhamnosidase